jgi:hypothetical protein
MGLAHILGDLFLKLLSSQSYEHELQRQRCKSLHRS